MRGTSFVVRTFRARFGNRSLAVTAAVLSILLRPALPASSSRDEGIRDFQHGRFSDALRKLKGAVRDDPFDRQARLYLALSQAARSDCKRFTSA